MGLEGVDVVVECCKSGLDGMGCRMLYLPFAEFLIMFCFGSSDQT